MVLVKSFIRLVSFLTVLKFLHNSLNSTIANNISCQRTINNIFQISKLVTSKISSHEYQLKLYWNTFSIIFSKKTNFQPTSYFCLIK